MEKNKKIMKKLSVLCLSLAMMTGIGIGISYASADSNVVYAADSSKGTTIAQNENNQLTITRQGLADPDSSATDWTIMVYLCGSDLESGSGAATDNINEILQYFENTKDESVNVLIQTGGAKSWQYEGISATTMQRYQAHYDSSQGTAVMTKVEDVSGANNIGTASSLQSFIEWGQSKSYKRSKMGLIFWDHGNGTINGLCNDEISGSHLSITDLDSALLGAKNSGALTQKFEFIGFDTCLMGNIDTANQIAPYAHYMIGSEELEPGGGWNYTTLLSNIQSNPSISGGALGKTVVDDFYTKCEEAGDYVESTLSSLNLDKLDDLLQSLNTAFYNIYTTKSVEEIAKVAYKANNFGGNKPGAYVNMVDIGNILQGFTDVNSVNTALTKLANGDDNFVIHNKNGASHNGAMGISTYYPLSIQETSDWQYFASVCPIPQYFNMADKVATALSGGDINEYTPAVTTTSDSSKTARSYSDKYDNINLKNNVDEFKSLEKGVLGAKSIYIDKDNYYTIEFDNLDKVVDANGVVYMEGGDADVYLGTVDNAVFEGNKIKDNFDGLWPQINGMVLPFDLISQNDTVNTYLTPVQITNASGKNIRTNLVITYDFNNDSYNIVGTWDGVDNANGYKTSRTTALQNEKGLQYNDTVAIVYDYVSDEDDVEKVSDKTFLYTADTKVEYKDLPAGDYDYGFVLSDAVGNRYYSEEVGMAVDANGGVSIYSDYVFNFNGTGFNYLLLIPIILGVCAVAAGVVVVIVMKKKKTKNK